MLIKFGIVSSVMTVFGLSIGIWTSGQGRIETLIASILGLSINNAAADSFSIYMVDQATSNKSIALQSAFVT